MNHILPSIAMRINCQNNKEIKAHNRTTAIELYPLTCHLQYLWPDLGNENLYYYYRLPPMKNIFHCQVRVVSSYRIVRSFISR